MRCLLALGCALGTLAAGPVYAAAPPAGTAIGVQAYADFYSPVDLVMRRKYSDLSQVFVAPVEALTLKGDAQLSHPPGTTVTIPYLLTNTGNVTSDFSFNLGNNAAGCSADTLDLGNLHLVQDTNNNGVADPWEALLSAPLNLPAGSSASILVVGDVPSIGGASCIGLRATTVLQSQSASVNTVVQVGGGPSIQVGKTATVAGALTTNSAIIYTVRAQNTGATAAAPASAAGTPTATTIMVARTNAPSMVATPMVLLRDPIPAGTTYVPSSLKTLAAGAVRLFHLPTDPPYSYRESADVNLVDEVAIGLPVGYNIPVGGAIEMSFQVKLNANGNTSVVNQGYVHYSDGASSQMASSNPVLLASTKESLGVALSAGQPQPQYNGSGVYDGTAIVRLNALLRNYGGTPAYDLVFSLPLQGAMPLLGNYTTSAVPGAGQYTLVGSPTVRSGLVLPLNPAYTGATGNDNLLASGGMLPAGAEILLEWDVRINFTNVASALLLQASATAARLPAAAVAMSDLSHNGTNPDPSGLGLPENYLDKTPISVPAALRIIKTAKPPVRLGNGQWEVEYTLTAINESAIAANNLRIIDNLACAVGKADGMVSWQLIGGPTLKSGSATVNPGFTGIPVSSSDPCNPSRDAATRTPLDMSVSLTDGTTSLAPRATVEIGFKVRVTVNKPAAILTNMAWAAAFSAPAGGSLLSASSTSVVSLLVDPQGVVYDSVTRLPITGATVTIKRESCIAGALGPITAPEVFPLPGITYSFDNANRSVSMVTDASGEYQFFFMSPPVTSMCDYSLTVAPPTSGLYEAQSTSIPAQPGVFATCGNVVPQATAPQVGDPTTYFRSVRVGQITAGPPPTICEVTHNNIPLDPAISGVALLLEKVANKKAVEFGDFLDYQLKVTNRHTGPLGSFTFTDVLPPGMAYMPGTTRVNGARAQDPAGGKGPQLTFAVGTPLAVGASVSVAFRVRVGVGSPTSGDATNRAWVKSGAIVSNEATATVRVTGGPFADDAYAVGKVFLDCNRNGEQDGSDEIGIPGVRILTETGVSVVTDVYGRWSIYGLKPITHVLHLDRATLPPGAEMMVLDNRNSGIADSRFLDLKKGELGKANFVVTNCGNRKLVDEVKARRKALEARVDAELESLSKARLPLRPEVAAANARNANASGATGTIDTLQATQPVATAPLIKLPASASQFVAAPTNQSTYRTPGGGLPATRDGGADLLGPLPAPGVVELETLVLGLGDALDFIDLQSGDTLPSSVTNVRVKGPLGARLVLSVNNQEIGERRVGKKVVLESTNVQALEYIGIELAPGENLLVLKQFDDFGNVRVARNLRLVAPDNLATISFVLPKELRADPLQAVPITLRLSDRAGVPVTSRTYLTLESDRGQWLAPDLNPNEPGVQVAVEGGQGNFEFQPPSEPGPGKLRATTNLLVGHADVNYLPQSRPLVGAGIYEEVLDFSRVGQVRLGSAMPGSAFEQELIGARGLVNGENVSGRIAFYFKGTIKGDFLLTAAYDSDKDKRDRLFRDIKPDEYYPVYGDSSGRAYDAQSSERVYVRIDKNRSYLLYGDFTTASSTEVRNLSQINRTLNGVKHQYADDNMRVTSFGSLDSTKQRIEEFPATGLSFYSLTSPGDIVANSEKVMLVSRSRSQPELVVSSTQLSRGVDYTLEPLSRRLQFVRPVPSVDANFNRQYIRVTYEVDGGGKEFAVGGVDAQFRVGEKLQVGVVGATDENPENRRELRAITGLARVGDNTTVAAEVVETHSDLKGDGAAGRIEARYESTALKAQAQVARVNSHFDNPGATIGAGRTEATARAEYTINPSTRLRAEALYSKDEAVAPNATGGSREDYSVAVQRKLSDNVVAEVGLHQGNTQGSGAGGFDYGRVNGITSATPTAPLLAPVGSGAASTTARARVTARLPALSNAEVFVEHEQSIDAADRSASAVGGQIAVTEKTRIYGRQEINSNLGGSSTQGASQKTASTVVGVESAYMEGGRIYNEARIGDAGGQNATGVRNSVRINENWSVTGGLEHTDVISAGNANPATSAAGSGSSNAVTVGAEYKEGPWRGSGAVENRTASGTESNLLSLGAAYKLSPDWTALARTHATVTDSATGGRQWVSRQQLGLAWRPADQDKFHGLLRFESRREMVSAGSTAASNLFDSGGGTALPGDTSTQVLTAIGNYNPEPGTYITARLAAKDSSLNDSVANSSYSAQLAHVRYTQDLNDRWDLGLQAGLLTGSGGAQQATAGVELGYQFAPNIWLSAGYNFVGLNDPDLAGANYTRDGLYVRLRVKFDEDDLGRTTDRKPDPRVSPRSGGPANKAPLAPMGPVDVSSAVVAPDPSRPVVPASMALWSPGQPLLQQLHYYEDQWFDGARSAKLSGTGKRLLQAIARQVAAQGVAPSDIEFSLARGERDSSRDTLWLQRMRAIRAHLTSMGLAGAVTVVDTQLLPPTSAADVPAYTGGSLVIALRSDSAPSLARARPETAESK